MPSCRGSKGVGMSLDCLRLVMRMLEAAVTARRKKADEAASLPSDELPG